MSRKLFRRFLLYCCIGLVTPVMQPCWMVVAALHWLFTDEPMWYYTYYHNTYNHGFWWWGQDE